MIKPKLPREFLQSELSKLPKNKYNCYQWWRRYQTKDQLSKKAPLYDKIVNGDYDHSTYYYQMEMELYLMEDKLKTAKTVDEEHEIRKLFFERYRRLSLDYQKEEGKTMQDLKSDFVKTFKLDRNELETFMETHDGTLLEMYQHFKSCTKKI